ncbi:hypothetical protein K474DRAFT_1673436 [Panus rudis PR-1116 ss-1]|nr:hypothetical protein K474DRAFT_654865 [Panus rudis PR-1116 ss-1]KAI0079418.1 hypothetical protein K474DRAFT_1673436 [Panus rudis PR-1116 ss-1]
MLAARRGFADQYPDDNSSKEVFLQAAGLEHAGDGDRHVLLRWINAVDIVKKQSIQSRQSNTFYSLGTFTRAQRDQIIALAKAVKYDKKSRVNSCRTWTRDLLEAMVNAGLISQAKFDEIDQGVPLKKRVPELPEDTA